MSHAYPVVPGQSPPPISADQQLANFFAQYPKVIIKDNQDILLPGHEPVGVYYVEFGYLFKYDISQRTGLEAATAIIDSRSIFPLTWGFTSEENHYFYRSLTTCQLRLAPRQAVNRFVHQEPAILWHLTQQIILRLDSLNARLERLALGNAKEKIYGELLYLAQYLGTKFQSTVVIRPRLTHQQLADLVGLSRETVSHILENAVRDKLISYDRESIIIHNLDRLAEQVNHIE